MVQSDVCAQQGTALLHTEIFSHLWETELSGSPSGSYISSVSTEKETEQMEEDEMKSSTSNGANLCQKKEGNIYQSSLNQLETQKYLSCWYCCKPMAPAAHLIKHRFFFWGGREGTKKAKSTLELASFCSSFPLPSHEMSGETKAAYPGTTCKGHNHLFPPERWKQKNRPLCQDRKDDSLLIKSSGWAVCG